MKEAEQKKESEVEKLVTHTKQQQYANVTPPLTTSSSDFSLVSPSPMIPKSKEEAGVSPVRNVLVLPIQISLLMGWSRNKSIGSKPKPLRGGGMQNCLVQMGRSTEQLKRPEV